MALRLSHLMVGLLVGELAAIGRESPKCQNGACDLDLVEFQLVITQAIFNAKSKGLLFRERLAGVFNVC